HGRRQGRREAADGRWGLRHQGPAGRPGRAHQAAPGDPAEALGGQEGAGPRQPGEGDPYRQSDGHPDPEGPCLQGGQGREAGPRKQAPAEPQAGHFERRYQAPAEAGSEGPGTVRNQPKRQPEEPGIQPEAGRPSEARGSEEPGPPVRGPEDGPEGFRSCSGRPEDRSEGSGTPEGQSGTHPEGSGKAQARAPE